MSERAEGFLPYVVVASTDYLHESNENAPRAPYL
jgi:hypothetical protein